MSPLLPECQCWVHPLGKLRRRRRYKRCECSSKPSFRPPGRHGCSFPISWLLASSISSLCDFCTLSGRSRDSCNKWKSSKCRRPCWDTYYGSTFHDHAPFQRNRFELEAWEQFGFYWFASNLGAFDNFKWQLACRLPSLWRCYPFDFHLGYHLQWFHVYSSLASFFN